MHTLSRLQSRMAMLGTSLIVMLLACACGQIPGQKEYDSWQQAIWNGNKMIEPASETGMGWTHLAPQFSAFAPPIEWIGGDKWMSYIVQDSAVFALDENRYPIKIDVFSGQLLWTAGTQGLLLGVHDTTVLVASDDDRVLAFDSDTGVEKWSFTPSSIFASGGVSPAGYTASYEEYILVPVSSSSSGSGQAGGIATLLRETGELTRYVQLEQGERVLAMCQGVALVSEFPSRDIHKGIDLATTDVIWNMLAGNAIRADYLDPESCSVYGHHLSEGNDTYVAQDSRSGQNVWSADVAASSKFIAIDDEVVIVEVKGEYLVLDRNSGSLINKIAPHGQVEKVLYANGLLFLSYPELGTTSAIDVTTGETAWENQDLAAKEMVEVGEVLIFRLEDDPLEQSNTLVGVSESSGEMIWSNVPIARQSEIVVHDNELYFGYSDPSEDLNGIVNLDPATGSIVVQTEPFEGEVASMFPLSGDSWLVEIMGNSSSPGTLMLNKLVEP